MLPQKSAEQFVEVVKPKVVIDVTGEAENGRLVFFCPPFVTWIVYLLAVRKDLTVDWEVSDEEVILRQVLPTR